jgi:hypothetical protein
VFRSRFFAPISRLEIFRVVLIAISPYVSLKNARESAKDSSKENEDNEITRDAMAEERAVLLADKEVASFKSGIRKNQ